jgi:hypothetical protein
VLAMLVLFGSLMNVHECIVLFVLQGLPPTEAWAKRWYLRRVR